MTDTHDIEHKFWKALRADRTAMLWLEGTPGSKPMTVLVDGKEDTGPFWIFTSTDTEAAVVVHTGHPANLAFSSKGHDIFASIEGTVTIDNDRAVIDRLWNPFVAAWYEGKDDPKLCLFRFDPSDAKAWIDASSLLAGVKLLLGADPKKDFQDKVSEIQF
ncbi:pyridoxamine 5'-phosphate oxidase family protein [Asticcacaulis sp.]|uniref:pyridoxamine 5'-phosphate oxidase family protein n=1 Tax=Asticcacaulis sp. TaxID=1872648 RepID=UPI003F7C403E